MNNTIALYSLLLVFVSCNSSTRSTNKTVLNPIDSVQESIDSTKRSTAEHIISNEDAKLWLIKAIDTYFNADSRNMQSLTTDEYFEFKTDAMNVELYVDNSLTQEEFEKKWKNKFDPTTHPSHIGFLISGQDWEKIVIEKCEQISSSSTDSVKFRLLLVDNVLQSKYNRDIVIVKSEESFKIADVLEYD